MADEVTRDAELRQRVDMLRERYFKRDANAAIVMHVRRGDFDKVDPDAFSDEYPRPIVSNRIEGMARHAVAALSTLPTMRCNASSMAASDRAKERADKRTEIVNHYFKNARFQEQMQIGADHLNCFGMIVTQVVPDFDEKMPVPTVRDSLGFYPVWDARGRTIEAAHIFRKRIVDLQAMYPEHHEVLDKAAKAAGARGGAEVEVYHHDDGKYVTILVPACNNLVLHRYKNPVGQCLFVCTKRPTPDGEVRGAFDDLVWVQLARNEMQMLALEAAEKAVDAPIALPLDASEFAFGPDAVIRSATPRDIGRVGINVPNEAFASIEHFKEEMEAGALVPQALSGTLDASVITGQGVQQLMAGYSQQMAMLQQTLVGHFERVVRLSLMLDEALWPDEKKVISGYRSGAEYEVSYVPSKDIDGNYEVDVTFGTSTGMSPNQHMVYLLQAQSAGLLSRDMVRRSLPGDINVDEESKIRIEQARDAVSAAVAGLGSAIPGLVAEGQNPAQVISQLAEYVSLLQKGKPPEEVAAKVFAPPKQEEQPAAADPMAQLMGAAGGGAEAGGMGGGEMEMQGAESAPPISSFFAGLTSSGDPNLGSYTKREQQAF